MPEGTVYGQLTVEPTNVSGVLSASHDRVEIKGESLGDPPSDWFYTTLAPDVVSEDSGEHFQKWDDMTIKGVTATAERLLERDGFFDEENKFLIFNKGEILMMIDGLRDAYNLTRETYI